jgi:hypothetical protein
MEVSGHLHAPAALPPDRILGEIHSRSERYGEKNILFLAGIEQQSSSLQPTKMITSITTPG